MVRARAKMLAMLFHNIRGRNNWLRKTPTNIISSTLKPSVSFLSETWITEEQSKLNTYKSFEKNKKEEFLFHAKRRVSGLGRAAGGLEMLTSRGVKPKEISKSEHHIGIAFADLYVIGIYYQL